MFHIIKWCDPSSKSEWASIDEIKTWVAEETSTLCTTIGRIAFEDKKCLVVCSSDNGAEDYGDCIIIYKSLIVSKEPLSGG